MLTNKTPDFSVSVSEHFLFLFCIPTVLRISAVLVRQQTAFVILSLHTQPLSVVCLL